MTNVAANALGSQQIADLLSQAGRAEQQRQEQQTISRILQTISGGGATIEDIVRASRIEPEFDPGISGFFQRFGSKNIPEPGRIGKQIGQGVISDALTRSLSGLSPEEQSKAARIRAGIDPRARLKQVEQFESTKAEKALDRDTAKLKKLIDNKQAKNSPRAERLRNQIRNNPASQPVEPGSDFTEILEEEKKVRVGKVDRAFGKDAYNKALRKLKDRALSRGFTEESVEEDFNNWWDTKAQETDPKGFGKFVIPRSEFQDDVEAPAKTSKIEPPKLPINTTQGKGNVVDEATARTLLEEAGGDPDKARKLATERGFKF